MKSLQAFVKLKRKEAALTQQEFAEKSAIDMIGLSFLTDEYKQKYTILLTERYDRIRN